MSRFLDKRSLALHGGVLIALFALQFILPDYHHGIMARVFVLAIFAVAYNIAFGYGGLLSLGHAMFFAAGVYGAGLAAQHLGWAAPLSFVAGILAGTLLASLVGMIALRTSGVSFMIVTLMFAQTCYLVSLYFNEYTRGDEGFVIPGKLRHINIAGFDLSLADPVVRYNLALLLFAFALFICLAVIGSAFGRVLIAIRENEERARLLGNNTYKKKLQALIISGALSGMAGAAYALFFGYAGATFATIQYSIYPLLWTLLGGVGTALGPFLGTVIMFYLVDIAGDFTSAYLLFVGLALVLMVLWFPKGILGTVRSRALRWLP